MKVPRLQSTQWLRPITFASLPVLFGGLIWVAYNGHLATDLPSDNTGGGGMDALQVVGPAKPEPEQIFVMANGDRIPWGTKDELGYVLPLDVKRSRSARAARPAPSLEEIQDRRRQFNKSTTSETRLGPNDGHTHNETTIDIDGNTVIGGWNQFNGSSFVMGVGRSTDRGQTWTSSSLSTGSSMSDPVVKSGGGSRWYYAYIASGGSGGGDFEVYVQRSDDDGLTWQSPVNATNNGSFDDKPYIDAAGDEVLVAWADFGFSPARVSAVRSLDGGLTFGSSQLVSTAGGNGALPIIAPNGTYHVFWRGSSHQFLWMVTSTDQGSTWSAPASIAPMSPLPTPLPNAGYRIVNLPSVAANPLNGDLVVVWNDQFFGDPDIVSVRSTDGGVTWSSPVKVNDDSSGEAQFFPWIDFDENGTAYAVWYDRRHNGVDLDVYLSSSTDGGATWGVNTRITASSFTPVLPWESGPADFIGDYNAVTAGGGEVFPLYQDARSGVQDVYVAVVDLSSPGCSVDADCDDGLFCNGAETCDSGSCQAGTDPCSGSSCNEAGDVCVNVQNAVYDAGLGAPACATVAASCDSTTLLDGRGAVGPEPNPPNTLDGCADGTAGNYHSDESNDRIVVSTLDGADMAEGATVEIEATVYAYSTGASDTADFYYAADANSPNWTYIGSVVSPGGGVQTITQQYTLPAGSLQAVRVSFRYQGTASPCSSGNWDDADDLVFAVDSTAQCTVDADCDDGAFCNGAETCNAGTCQAGTVVSCDDGVSCTDDSCNESTDTCDYVANDGNCDNGLFCDGTEICDPVNDCQAGSDPCSGGETCDEVGDVCTGGDPVIVTFTSIGSEDGWVRESNETSNVGGSSNSTGSGSRPIRPGDGTNDRQYKAILSFDTSSIPPGATIQSATLRLRRGTVRGSDPFTSGFGSCRVDVMSGGFSGSTALQSADFEAAATATAAATLSAPAANGDWSEGALSASGLAAINLSGTTQVRVYFDLDDNDDGGDDHMGYYSGDHSSAANHPQLVVTYVP